MSDEIKCHGDVSQGGIFRFGQPKWESRESEPYIDGYRHCSYCGSLHPEDLMAALKAGATMHGSDWKYGWPHKFYVTVPNRIAGKVVEMGGESGPNITKDTPGAVKREGYWHKPFMEPAPATCQSKFYSTHLGDCSAAVIEALTPLLTQHTGIVFNVDPEKGVGYRAPRPGYQR